MKILERISEKIYCSDNYYVFGSVASVNGSLIHVKGLNNFLTIGSWCEIMKNSGQEFLRIEVVGFVSDVALCVPFGDVYGVAVGDDVRIISDESFILPSLNWKGRVIDCFANPIDNKGVIENGNKKYLVKNSPIKAHSRARVGGRMDMGVKSVNIFAPCCVGQRLGVFAGSGVGKSVLLSMFTKYADADVKVIALIGERGREVLEFIEDYLGEEGLKNAVIVVATSDEPAIARRQAACVAMSVAEYFRDEGLQVLLMMDSVTRFAMALREIGLIAGQPPTTKGYPASVFSELPRLLERAGPGLDGSGSITALLSILVEGDDHNEIISDMTRSILDGHIVLDRDIASSGRFPAVNILSSISRMAPGCNNEDENQLILEMKKYYSKYINMKDLIAIGAYKEGADSQLDLAIKLFPQFEQLLTQKPHERFSINESYDLLKAIMAG